MTTIELQDYEARSRCWRWRDHRDGQSGTYRMGSFAAWIQDYDGDRVGFELKRREEVLLAGEFDNALGWEQAVFLIEEKLVELGVLVARDFEVRLN